MKIFKYRNFSLMFFGRIVSNIGDSLYAVAAILLIYQLGGSTFYTGLAGFLSILPRFVEFCSGPLIDRIPIRSLLVRTQLIQAGLLLLIPLAAGMDFLSVALVLVLTPIIATFNVLIFPAQLAALPKVLPEEELTRGNSYFTIAYQGIDISFNGLAGILFVLIGPFALYLVNSVAFLVGAAIFYFIRMPDPKGNAVVAEKKPMRLVLTDYIADLREGAAVLFGSFLTKLLFGVIILNLVSAATFAVFPAYGEVIGGTAYVGFLLMASALGGLTGALSAPYLRLEKFPLGKLYAGAFLLAGTLWTAAVLMPYAWATLVCYALAWIPSGATNIVIFTTLQKTAPKHLIGRIFTAATSVSGIASPIGHLLGGSLGVWIGSSLVVLGSGVIVFLVAVGWLLSPAIRGLPATGDMAENSLVAMRKDGAMV